MTVLLQISVSVDGYVAGADISEDEPMGRDGERLHDWMFRTDDDVHGEIQREVKATAGAVVVGKRTFDLGVGPWGDVPYPLPTFVVTHEVRDDLVMKSGTFTFVTDGVESAIQRAKAAAGGKDVIVMGGATIAQQALRAGLVEEIHLAVAHVLLGGGTRLFDALGSAVELEPLRVVDLPYATRLRFRVLQG
jgi:dihydrofolate reductase